MRKLIKITLLATGLLAACSSHEGTYAPACIAYAGDTIRLHDGRFHWDKFTDQIIIGNDGKAADQYPDHPLQGTYRIDGNRLLLVTDTGESLDDRYFLDADERTYLLDVEQYDAWQDTGQFPECALALGRESNPN